MWTETRFIYTKDRLYLAPTSANDFSTWLNVISGVSCWLWPKIRTFIKFWVNTRVFQAEYCRCTTILSFLPAIWRPALGDLVVAVRCRSLTNCQQVLQHLVNPHCVPACLPACRPPWKAYQFSLWNARAWNLIITPLASFSIPRVARISICAGQAILLVHDSHWTCPSLMCMTANVHPTSIVCN